MNIFSKRFWKNVGKGLKKNPITDFVGNFVKESGLQTDAEDEYKRIKNTDPNTIEERAHQIQDKVDGTPADNTDLADAATNAAVDAGIDAATDAAEGAILEEREK